MRDHELHVVFGVGQVGTPLVRALRARGHEVRAIRRSGSGMLDDLPVLQGDAGDRDFTASVTSGAHAIYVCISSPSTWTNLEYYTPRLTRSLIGAASRSGARLVVFNALDCVGSARGRTLCEDSSVVPEGRINEHRADMTAQLLAADRAGHARVFVALAPDLFGPGGGATHFSYAFWNPLFQGRPAHIMMPPDVPHAFAYTLDVAAGLAVLGAASDEDSGRWWLLPSHSGLSVRALSEHFAVALERPIALGAASPRSLGVATAYGMRVDDFDEVRQHWQHPYLVDDSRFRTRFEVEPTPLDEAARATVAWARETFDY